MKKRKLIVELKDSDEIIEREAKKFGGNASHVILPPSHIGKKVMIVCSKDIKLDIEVKK